VLTRFTVVDAVQNSHEVSKHAPLRFAEGSYGLSTLPQAWYTLNKLERKEGGADGHKVTNPVWGTGILLSGDEMLRGRQD
jgi:hypothetical protein